VLALSKDLIFYIFKHTKKHYDQVFIQQFYPIYHLISSGKIIVIYPLPESTLLTPSFSSTSKNYSFNPLTNTTIIINSIAHLLYYYFNHFLSIKTATVILRSPLLTLQNLLIHYLLLILFINSIKSMISLNDSSLFISNFLFLLHLILLSLYLFYFHLIKLFSNPSLVTTIIILHYYFIYLPYFLHYSNYSFNSNDLTFMYTIITVA
jgi:hypothetical protein